MAYSATITKDYKKGLYTFTIVELEAAATSEYTLTGVPDAGYVISQICTLASGTGTTIDPILGTATAPAGVTLRVANGTAAASVNNIQSGGGVPYRTATANSLFGRSVPNDATADHSITTVYEIVASKPR